MSNWLSRWIGLLVVSFSVAYAPKATAGVPVIDLANLAQAIEQVRAWVQQYQQMERDYRQQVQYYESVTGNRGLGRLLNSPILRELVPNDLVAIYNNVNGGGLSGAASALRASQRVYNCTGLLLAADEQRCQASLNQIAERQVHIRGAYERLVLRTENIDALREEINATEDLKAVGELQARMQAEIAQVSNDQNKVQTLIQMADMQKEVTEQTGREAMLENLQSPDDGLEGLSARVIGAWGVAGP